VALASVENSRNQTLNQPFIKSSEKSSHPIPLSNYFPPEVQAQTTPEKGVFSMKRKSHQLYNMKPLGSNSNQEIVNEVEDEDQDLNEHRQQRKQFPVRRKQRTNDAIHIQNNEEEGEMGR